MAKAKYSFNEKRREWYTLVYDGTLTETGAKHRKRIASKKSSADLERKVNAFKQALASDAVAVSNITLGEYSRRWFDLYKSNTEKNTQKMYRLVVFSYLAPLDSVRLCDLKRAHLQALINEHSDHPKTCRNIKQTFGQIIRAAVLDGFLPRTAAEGILAEVSLPKYIKPQKRALNAVEIDALKRAELDPRKRAFVSVLFFCGLRRGEALALTADDFDWKACTVSVSKVVIFDGNRPELKPYPKSDNSIRLVPLPDAAIDVLKPYAESCEGFLFTGTNGPLMTETAYRRMWSSIITSMNVACGYNPQQKQNRTEKPIQNLTAHVFRHNYCTQLCYQIPTISTKMIARLMGDTEKVVLNVYSHILEERENVAGAVNSAFDLITS